MKSSRKREIYLVSVPPCIRYGVVVNLVQSVCSTLENTSSQISLCPKVEIIKPFYKRWRKDYSAVSCQGSKHVQPAICFVRHVSDPPPRLRNYTEPPWTNLPWIHSSTLLKTLHGPHLARTRPSKFQASK